MNRHLRNARQSTFSRVGIAKYARKYCLQPADRIKESIFQTGFTKHHSVYLGIDQNCQEWIAENHWQHGVRLVKADDYFKNGNNYTFDRFEGIYNLRIAAVKRALSVLGKPYDLVHYNCEHYASYVQAGKAESKQVWNALLLALFLVLLGFTSKDGGGNV